MVECVVCVKPIDAGTLCVDCLAAMLAPAPTAYHVATSLPECVWTEDDAGCWSTACGRIFEFASEGPGRNGFKFCPWCGQPLVARPCGEDEHD